MQKYSWLNRSHWGIHVYEYLLVFGMYFFIACCYHVTLYIDSLSYNPERPLRDLFSLWEFMDNVGIQYLIRFILTVGIWWVIFIRFRHLKLIHRLLFHLIGFPLFIILSQILE